MKVFISILLIFIWVKGFGQQPIFVSYGGNLYSVNLISCTSRLVSSNPKAVEYGDLAFTPDGKLWGCTEGFLYSIDTTNGSSTFIGISKGLGVSLVALNDSVLLSEVKDSLWSINVNNLKTYNLGNIGSSATGDLTWYDNDLYMSSRYLIKIVLNNTNTAIITSAPVSNNPMLDFEGLVTASFPGEYNSIVSWSGTNTYKICPIDGTYQLLCTGDDFYVPGAASIRLPTQNPLPTSCEEIFPVHLLNFTSTLLNKTVQLQWQTTSEINSSYFLIERSVDGINFSGIGKVNAAGNSTALKQYSFIDNSPLSVNYYRLKEVDLDGKYTYSKILLVKMQSANALNILQNPVQNVLQLQINASSSQTNYLSIFDFSGRRIKTFNTQNGAQNIDVSFLSSGTYLLQLITADGNVFAKPFVKR